MHVEGFITYCTLFFLIVLSYKTALKCITYLSSDHLVREDRLLMSGSGNSVLVKRLLKAIDNSEVSEMCVPKSLCFDL